MWARASVLRRFTDTNVYGTGTVKIMENSPQNNSGYTDIFTVYGRPVSQQRCRTD